MSCRVLIAGGGVGALEAALALRDLSGERTQVELFAPRREFVYRPYAVGEPYGVARVEHHDLQRLAARAGASFQLASIAAVEADARLAVSHDGDRIPYDYLVLAPGAQRFWPLPGAMTFWGLADEAGMERLLTRLRRGRIRRIAFTVPGGEAWSLPAYELALLTEAELERRPGAEAELAIVTAEATPLQVFGRGASEGVAALLAERGVRFYGGERPSRFARGRLEVVPRGQIEADAVVSLPCLEGRRIAGVPHDEEGFIPVDEHCRVLGEERLFAVGDVTSFPVKQGGIATQQADVAAEAIAAEVGGDLDPQRFDPVLRAELWTGRDRRYLEGWLAGGHGESSTIGTEPPWGESRGKIVGRYVSDFLAAA
jgi:sulfide:quinone oxidoreductase